MNTSYIIKADYLKKYYPGYVESNIDDNSLNSFILISQDVNIQSILGYNMYRYIIDALVSFPTGSSLSAKYLELLTDFVRPSLALWSIYNAYPNLLYKATNKSVVTKSSDDSNVISIKELEYIRTGIRNNAEFYDSRIKEFIMNNTTDFMEYFTTSGINRVKSKSNTYSGGIYLKPRRRNCR